MEREHERDEFQQEINRLEAHLRQTTRGQAGGENRGQRVRFIHEACPCSLIRMSPFLYILFKQTPVHILFK